MAIREIVELVARVTDLERRVSGMMRHGRVAEVDMDMLRVRLDLGPAHGSGGRFLSPWVPYAQFAGALKVHTPPEVGQQFTLVSPTGDFQQAVAMPLHWSSPNPTPSNWTSENVLTFGDVRIEIKKDQVVIKVGNSGLVISDGGVRVWNAGLSVDKAIFANQPIVSGTAVWPPSPAGAPSQPGPKPTGSAKVPSKVPGT